MKKEIARSKMNELGKEQIPFLFIIDYEMQNSIVKRINEIDNEKIMYSFNGFSNVDLYDVEKEIDFDISTLNFEQYQDSFEKIKENIFRGNSYLVNLTFESEVRTNLNLEDIFRLSEAKYKLLYENKFTFFSPEIFVRIIDGKIYSFPMKGTIDASIPDAENKIITDEKEIAEHYTIVDLIRNDLNIVAKNVKVEQFRYVDYIHSNKRNLLQISSEISGDLELNFNEKLGDILFSLLPAGSITGAPKKKTVEIIKEVENYNRGYYTGIAGIFDGKNLDSCVMIRFIEKRNNKLYYKSGGGITFLSNAKKEYAELIDKIYIPI